MRKKRKMKSFQLFRDEKAKDWRESVVEGMDFLQRNKQAVGLFVLGFTVFPVMFFLTVSLKEGSTGLVRGFVDLYRANISSTRLSLDPSESIYLSSSSTSSSGSASTSNTNTNTNTTVISSSGSVGTSGSSSAGKSNTTSSTTSTTTKTVSSDSKGYYCPSDCYFNSDLKGCYYNGSSIFCGAASTDPNTVKCASGFIYCASSGECLLSRDYGEGMCPQNSGGGPNGDDSSNDPSTNESGDFDGGYGNDASGGIIL